MNVYKENRDDLMSYVMEQMECRVKELIFEEIEKHVRVFNLANKTGLVPKNKANLSHCSQTQCLTNREKEVLILVANGYSRQEISKALGVTHNTACTHVANIYSKLNISCIAEATQYAVKHMAK